MKGFFTKKETQSLKRPDGKTLSCHSCGLYQKVLSPKMKPFGKFKKKIMVIGEAPGETEDRRGRQWQGKAGRVLQKTFSKLGVDLFEDCVSVNSINCRPTKKTGNRTPTNFEIDCCRRIVLAAIDKYKPKVIILVGGSAVYSIIGHRWKKDLGGLNKWRGFQIPDQDFKAWICPVYHPSYIMREDTKQIHTIWEQDLKNAFKKVNKKIPIYKAPKIHYINDLKVLEENIKSQQTISFDYETTGLKPHSKGHRIVCASIAVSEEEVYTFEMPKSKAKKEPFKNILRNKYIKKMAHNMKFEHTWTDIRLKTKVKGWYWDSMLAAHVEDNRTGITSLKFQTYIHFGIVDYDSEVSPYLQADKKNGNSKNTIQELMKTDSGVKKVLEYCALDSIFEYRLAKLQQKRIKDIEGYNLLHNGTLALYRAERTGLQVDVEYINKTINEIKERIVNLEKEIKSTTFFKKWQRVSKSKVNIYSPQQLGFYLYDIKKLKPPKTTPTGKGSTDDESLTLLNIPETNKLLEIKKLKKTKDYLLLFKREQYKGVLRPFFNLHTALTYRSSSDRPNFQNIPKRDAEAMTIVRKSIKPRKGHQLLELDYKQLEVGIAACYHKDPTMLKYIKTDHDMHGDMAKQIFMIEDFDKKVHKDLRSASKNGFVFPQFYGDYYKNCADYLITKWVKLKKGKWRKGQGIKIGNEHISDILIRNGIKNYEQFENHLQEIEYDFWKNRFPVYDKWRETWWKKYQVKGSAKAKSGFTFKGLMGRNDVINYPVQGAAFHVLLWSLIQATKAFQREGFKTKIIGQIHDAIVLDVHPKELKRVIKIMQCIMENDVKQHFKWINIPLKIEAELCPVDGSWAEKEEIKI